MRGNEPSQGYDASFSTSARYDIQVGSPGIIFSVFTLPFALI